MHGSHVMMTPYLFMSFTPSITNSVRHIVLTMLFKYMKTRMLL